MPTVPVSRGPEVSTAPLARADAPVESFGGGAADHVPQLEGAADIAANIYQRQKQETNQVAVLDAVGKATDLSTKLTITARSRMGKDAFTTPDEVKTAWDTGTSEIEQGLSNDDQKLAFAQAKQSRWEALNGAVQSHVATQHQVVSDEASKGTLTALQSDLLANYNVPATRDMDLAQIAGTLKLWGAHNGLPDEAIAANVAEATSKMHVAVIQRMLANEDLNAKDYFAQVKDSITGQDITAVEKDVHLGSSRGESQKQADAIWATGKPEPEMNAMVEQIKDPLVRDLTQQRIDKHLAEAAKQAQVVKVQTYAQATNIVEQTGDFNRIPPATVNALTLSERRDLREYADKITKGDPIKTDIGTWYDLRKMAANPDTQAAFSRLDLNRYKSKLADGDFKQVADWQAGIVSKDAGTESKLKGFMTNDQIVESGLKGAGLLDMFGTFGDARKAKEDTVNQLKQTINAQVLDLEGREKRPATTKEVTEITNEILVQHLVSAPGTFYGVNERNARLDEMRPNETLVIHQKDIPPADRAAIAASLRSQGLPAAPDAVVEAYKKSLLRLRRRGGQ